MTKWDRVRDSMDEEKWETEESERSSEEDLNVREK